MTPDLQSTLDAAEALDEARDAQWRRDEHEIDGAYCGCEYPRLWPPRRRIDSRVSR